MSFSVLVTGATKGIGRELVKQLTARGHRVFATGRDAAGLASLKQETGCRGEVCDLAAAAAVVEIYAQARAALGQVDVLVNNAGYNSQKAPLAQVTLEDFDAQYAVNLRAPWLLCREALRDMGVRKTGHIVNVISTVAHFANENMGVYTAMKAGLRGLNGVLLKEARPLGIKVTAVYPGGVNTGFRKQARPDYMKPESVATVILQAMEAPADVVIHELTFRPLVESNF